MNERIRAREVRLIDADGKQLGVVATPDALRRARQVGLDLVEISPDAQPPVCKILDFGKYRYEMAKKERESRKHASTGGKMKELQFHANIDPHDLEIKLNHARGFLEKDMRVRCMLRFRGREMAHIEFGKQVMEKVIKGCEDIARVESPPRMMGRTITMMLTPGKASAKRTAAQAQQPPPPRPAQPFQPRPPQPPQQSRPASQPGSPVLGDNFKLPPDDPNKK
jgi:translation initiation factor IF-3